MMGKGTFGLVGEQIFLVLAQSVEGGLYGDILFQVLGNLQLEGLLDGGLVL